VCVCLYNYKGVEIVSTPDQNATDFTKCLQLVIERLQRNESTVTIATATTTTTTTTTTKNAGAVTNAIGFYFTRQFFEEL